MRSTCAISARRRSGVLASDRQLPDVLGGVLHGLRVDLPGSGAMNAAGTPISPAIAAQQPNSPISVPLSLTCAYPVGEYEWARFASCVPAFACCPTTNSASNDESRKNGGRFGPFEMSCASGWNSSTSIPPVPCRSSTITSASGSTERMPSTAAFTSRVSSCMATSLLERHPTHRPRRTKHRPRRPAGQPPPRVPSPRSRSG